MNKSLNKICALLLFPFLMGRAYSAPCFSVGIAAFFSPDHTLLQFRQCQESYGNMEEGSRRRIE